MENMNKVSDNNEMVAGTVETPVQQNDNWWAKTKRFGKKHKKGLIAGALGVLATVVICATRKSDDEGGDFVEDESMEMEPSVEIAEE